MSDEEDFLEEEWEAVYDDGFGAQADDLAEHSHPSPPYLGYDSDGVDDVHDSDMDMEGAMLEYLDFYYDDDPTLMNASRWRDQPPTSTKKRKGEEPVRAAKRRKTNSENPTPQQFLENSIRTGRGIIYKARDQSNPPPYRPGEGEKVALLKDWRQLTVTLTTGEEQDTMSPPALFVRGRSQDNEKESSHKQAELHQSESAGRRSQASRLPGGLGSHILGSPSRSSPLKHGISADELASQAVRTRQGTASESATAESTASSSSRKRRIPDASTDEDVKPKRRAAARKGEKKETTPNTRQARGRAKSGT